MNKLILVLSATTLLLTACAYQDTGVQSVQIGGDRIAPLETIEDHYSRQRGEVIRLIESIGYSDDAKSFSVVCDQEIKGKCLDYLEQIGFPVKHNYGYILETTVEIVDDYPASEFKLKGYMVNPGAVFMSSRIGYKFAVGRTTIYTRSGSPLFQGLGASVFFDNNSENWKVRRAKITEAKQLAAYDSLHLVKSMMVNR